MLVQSEFLAELCMRENCKSNEIKIKQFSKSRTKIQTLFSSTSQKSWNIRIKKFDKVIINMLTEEFNIEYPSQQLCIIDYQLETQNLV